MFVPATAESFDKLDGDIEALAGELSVATLGGKGFAVGVDDFQVTDDTRAISFGGEIGCASCVGDGALLGSRLIGQVTNPCETVLDIAKSDQDLLAIVCNTLLEGSLGTLVVRAVASPGEKRE